ncbi:hypothetical protein [Chitinophaga arvensicola]|uniref:DUF4468 domain-containing protein n=1 Tax=Chitinophaga arvensicola TaxID=29529 RepID=A0A1I0R8L1_9BACT|nr:hypothetical protein [Chitinophaga arvensicola]SEW37054.1 hypothetical protein SAMN04488122_2465 [Chitinophaga arvensicola]
MRKLLLLLIFMPAFVVAQNSPYKYYKLDKGELLFENIYHVDSLTADQIGAMLKREIPKIQGIVDIRTEGNLLTGRIRNSNINYRKAGHNPMNTYSLLDNPFDAGVTIEWKDGRYRVTLSGVVFHTGKDFNKVFLNTVLIKKGSEWYTNKMSRQIGNYSEEYYASIFSVTNNDNW